MGTRSHASRPRPPTQLIAPIRVASVPAGHPYVRHLAAPVPLSAATPARAVIRLPDPHPDHPGRDDLVADGRWWPPVMLRPDWLARADFDLLHLHFGYDDQTPDQLRTITRVLAERGRPLVLTVHDLRNPHHLDPGTAEAQLGVLVPAAAGVVTLTEAAADLVAARWGRRPQVIPHPHVVDLPTMARLRQDRRPGRGTFRVGVACKDLRANTDPLRVLPTLLGAVQDIPGASLVVTIHRGTHERPRSAAASDLVRWLGQVAERPEVEVVVHDRLDDAALWEHLAGIDVAVLPYRFGTHSGWLEACHDVGTSVIAPDIGCYADQGADFVHGADDQQIDTTALTAAVHAAHADWCRRVVPGLDTEQRRHQRQQIVLAHCRLYEAALQDARAAV